MKTPSMRLDGKKALVTGASRGIGLACAQALAESGADVMMVAREQGPLEQAARELEQAQPNGSITFETLDLTATETVNQFFERQPAFDILVNNAGMNRPGDLREISNQDIEEVIELNLTSVLATCRAFALQPRTGSESASIINISSQMGLVGAKNRAVYCASKHGVEGLTKALAVDLGPEKIRINTICPTFTETQMTKHMLEDEDFKASVLAKIPLGDIASPQDIMGAVVFLASPAARMITGSSIVIDGGWTAV